MTDLFDNWLGESLTHDSAQVRVGVGMGRKKGGEW